MNPFRVSIRAKLDLVEIGQFTDERWGKTQRNGYLAAIHHAMQQIADNPGLSKLRTEVSKAYFSFPAGKHVIFYRRSTDCVEIMRVLHHSMDIQQAFSQWEVDGSGSE